MEKGMFSHEIQSEIVYANSRNICVKICENTYADTRHSMLTLGFTMHRMGFTVYFYWFAQGAQGVKGVIISICISLYIRVI